MLNILLKILIIVILPNIAFAEKRLACFGDSVTLGRGIDPASTFCSLVANKFNMTAFNFGVGGDNTDGGLNRLNEVLLSKPHFLIIMFGLNDSFIDEGRSTPRVPIDQYKKNLEMMIRQARSKNVKVILATSNPTSNVIHNANLKPFVNVVRRIARKRNIMLVDTYAIFSEYIMEGDYPWFDGVHLTESANVILANQFINKIRKLHRINFIK